MTSLDFFIVRPTLKLLYTELSSYFVVGEPSLSTQTNLTIKVFAESTPNFTQVVYESSIPENIPISSAVTTVNAESTHGNKIIYTISEGDPDNEFTVHFSTGIFSIFTLLLSLFYISGYFVQTFDDCLLIEKSHRHISSLTD